MKVCGFQAIGKSRGGWDTRVHLVVSDARKAVTFGLPPGQTHDSPEGRRRLDRLGPVGRPVHPVLVRANEGNEARLLALNLELVPAVAPLL